MWSLQVLLVVVGSTAALEVGIPERYLQPRNFNPHPYTDVAPSGLDIQSGYVPAGIIPQLVRNNIPDIVRDSIPELPEHPYALFRRPPSRGQDDRAPVQFPKVPEAANIQPSNNRLKPPDVKHPLNFGGIPQQRLINPQEVRPDKKYAFSYSVLDRSSGDDFSHSQAGSSGQTKGEYRVKLPDGRIQVVSYTADHRGYRADVRYDEHNFVEPQFTQTIYRQPAPEVKQPYKTVLYDYEDTTLKPARQFTPIHEDYGDYQENTVSSTPSYRQDTAVTGYVQQVPARGFQESPPRFISSPAKFLTTQARFIGSTPSPLVASPSPLKYGSEDFYFTTPSPLKLFVGPDGQLYRQ